MRILVTGSRDWPGRSLVYAELMRAFENSEGDFVVVEGGARGADRFAADWALALGREDARVRNERYPADWARHGKAAGFIRNQEMVDLDADLCLAFRYNGSRGTTDCLERVRKAGIPCRLIDLTLTETNGGK